MNKTNILVTLISVSSLISASDIKVKSDLRRSLKRMFSQNFDVDTTNGGINSTANTATLKAFIGYEFNGSSATSEDQATKVRDQYLDNIFEVVRLVKS